MRNRHSVSQPQKLLGIVAGLFVVVSAQSLFVYFAPMGSLEASIVNWLVQIAQVAEFSLMGALGFWIGFRRQRTGPSTYLTPLALVGIYQVLGALVNGILFSVLTGYSGMMNASMFFAQLSSGLFQLFVFSSYSVIVSHVTRIALVPKEVHIEGPGTMHQGKILWISCACAGLLVVCFLQIIQTHDALYSIPIRLVLCFQNHLACFLNIVGMVCVFGLFSSNSRWRRFGGIGLLIWCLAHIGAAVFNCLVTIPEMSGLSGFQSSMIVLTIVSTALSVLLLPVLYGVMLFVIRYFGYEIWVDTELMHKDRSEITSNPCVL